VSQGDDRVPLSVDDVARDASRLAREGPGRDELAALVRGEPVLAIEGLNAGYGKMEILHDVHLHVGSGQSLCLIGPNGAGKSTILHSIYGFARVFSGSITAKGREVTALAPNAKLRDAGIAYVLQDNSVFPDMTVEENLWMGGYLMSRPQQAKQAAERIFEKYAPLANRRGQPARVLSGGERRLLEISRALIMDPTILLIDEPSIGLEPRFIAMVFDFLSDLQRNEGKTIVMVEQNAKKGLEFADLGYVLVSGRVAMAGTGDALLEHPEVGRLFLGG
jgi:branched-chain amino acid transport system ATP-binding protein